MEIGNTHNTKTLFRLIG